MFFSHPGENAHLLVVYIAKFYSDYNYRIFDTYRI